MEHLSKVNGNPPGKVIKEYLPKEGLQLFRFDSVITFTCYRCVQKKTSKLVAIRNSDWTALLCNSCYGKLVSNQK